ncbi:MAG: hypothetical protein IJ141_01555 [Lachnospiraceae bacterium]|nr:hypothetical protein [Lachnospiraceae bacterium]
MKLKKIAIPVICSAMLAAGSVPMSVNAEENTYKEAIEYITEEDTQDLYGIEEDNLYVAESARKIKTRRTISQTNDGTKYVSGIKEYDINGNITKNTLYRADGSILVMVYANYECEYDDNGNLIKWIRYTGASSYETLLYEYDKNGNLTKETGYYSDANSPDWYSEYEYDEAGNISMKKDYEKGQSSDTYIMRTYITYDYDTNGNLFKETISAVAGSTIIYKYEYDSNGNLVKWTICDSNEKPVSDTAVTTWEYDSNNNMTRFNGQDRESGAYYNREWMYDENGNEIKEINYNYTDDSVKDYTAKEYDSNGNMIKEISYDSNDSITYYTENVYDEYNNIIKASRYGSDGKLTSVTEYEYDFYDSEEATKEDKEDEKTDASKDEKSDESTEKTDKESEASSFSPIGKEFSDYEGNAFYKDEKDDVRCYDSDGKPVIDKFACDGTYTYYFQADGTAMKDRLTYHPDGVHVIYFDSEGHEVFSDFANVKKTIAGDEVDDFCFFDVFGYMYVDVVTYDKTGTVLYYANAYGVMEMGKWFQFSDKVTWADGREGDEFKGGYGCANADGTLITNTQTVDWEGRSCYLQGNGVALY